MSNNVIRIFEVRTDGRQAGQGYSSSGSGRNYSQSAAAELAENAIQAVNEIKPSANYAQLGQYLLPIRKAAAQLRVKTAAHSLYSSEVRMALQELKNKIQAACEYLDQNLETDTNFDIATDLMTIKEKISAMML
jgi:hypothetical protein